MDEIINPDRLVSVPFNKTRCGVDFYINTAINKDIGLVLTENKAYQIPGAGLAELRGLLPAFTQLALQPSRHPDIAYALFVLFCFWAGAQLLNLLVHAPGVYERLMQVQETGRPRVEIGLGVGTIFGLIPFLVGCLIFAVVALWLHWRHRRQ